MTASRSRACPTPDAAAISSMSEAVLGYSIPPERAAQLVQELAHIT